jgi:hypothetical protein
MTWADVLEILCNDTLTFATRLNQRGEYSEGIENWVINFESETAYPKQELEQQMKLRYDELITALEPNGLGWRTDSRVLKKYVRTGNPDIESITDMMICMRFLHEQTPYKYIKSSVQPPSARVHHEPLTRVMAIDYFLSHGGTEDELPSALLDLWRAKQMN